MYFNKHAFLPVYPSVSGDKVISWASLCVSCNNLWGTCEHYTHCTTIYLNVAHNSLILALSKCSR